MLNHTVQLWTGLEYHSLEKCNVREYFRQKEITGVIIGYYQQEVYKAEYTLVIDQDWNTTEISISFERGILSRKYNLKLNEHAQWTNNGTADEILNGCTDVDISLTPFTNTLPIRRLKLKPGESQQIRVVYFDLLAQTCKPVNQKYSCLNTTQYKFENVPNDFEAIITVDDQGFVTNYPGLFEQTAVEVLNG